MPFVVLIGASIPNSDAQAHGLLLGYPSTMSLPTLHVSNLASRIIEAKQTRGARMLRLLPTLHIPLVGFKTLGVSIECWKTPSFRLALLLIQ